MKKTLLYTTLLGLAGLFSFTACGDDEEPQVATTLSATPASITLENEVESTKTFTITCNADWTITKPASADWFKLSTIIGTSNATITVTVVSTNPDAEIRSARLDIAAGDKTVSVVLSQSVVPTAPAQATISGDHENECPTKTVTLSASATGANTYLWYKDDVKITDATNASYVVTESGNYAVIGVNEIGLGNKSTTHAVNITECIPDVIEGAWTANGWDFFEKTALAYDENIEAITSTKFLMKNLFQNLSTHITKDGEGKYWFNPSSEKIGTANINGQSYDIFQTVGAYETRETNSAYILQDGIELTLSADGKTLSLPESITLEFQDGSSKETTLGIGIYTTANGQNAWLELIGEMTFTRDTSTESSQTFTVKTSSIKTSVYRVKGEKASKLKR